MSTDTADLSFNPDTLTRTCAQMWENPQIIVYILGFSSLMANNNIPQTLEFHFLVINEGEQFSCVFLLRDCVHHLCSQVRFYAHLLT